MQKLRILNLGAGVQSTTLALMAETGEIPKFDYAIFADVQAEPSSVYHHLDWLKSQLSCPVIVRSRGSLVDNLKSGMDGKGGRFCSIPAFTGQLGRLSGIIRRQCTSEFKIKVIEDTIKREILKLPLYGRIPKDLELTQVFGLSHDEQTRIFKVQRAHLKNSWKLEFPLYELEMNRSDCINWLNDYGVPHLVPRSACYFCPYHSNQEWQRLKTEEPEEFEKAVEIDRLLREDGTRANKNMNELLWLHRSCRPLDSIDFAENQKTAKGQNQFGFLLECEGMCGV